MTHASSWFTAPVVMALVALVCALGAVYIATRPVATEQGSYARRLAATMLAAMAIILGVFSWTLGSWGPGR